MTDHHALLEHMPLPLALVCGKGTIIESSPALRELLGYRDEELDGVAFDELVRADRADTRRSLRALFDGGCSYEQLATVLRRDGSTTDVRLRAWPEDDGAARCAAMLFEPRSLATDETTVLDRMTDGFVAFDRQWRFTFVNRAAEEYFRRPRLALLGRVVWEALPRTVGTEIEREYRRAAASPVPVEFQLVTPLRRRLMQFRAYPSSTGVSIYFHDDTDAHHAEERARFVADATAALAESLDVEETLDTITSLVVPRLADLCLVDLIAENALVRAAVVHRDPTSFGDFEALRRHAPELASEVPVARAARTGQPQLVSSIADAWLRSVTANDEHFAAAKKTQMRSAMIVPMVTSGRTLGVLSLISSEPGRTYRETDLTYATLLAHRAAVALAHARTYDEAVRARRARDDLLAIVSHDLRAPLNVIQLSASVLERERHTDEAAAILRGVARANRLIQDLLIVTQLDAGQLPLDRHDETPEALLAELVDLFGAAAREKGVTLVAEAESGLPTVWVDRHRIHQVLANLVGNALKFTGQGGRIEVRALRAGPNVRIDVTDTGPGIAKDALAHVFDRFWQAAHARRAGAGLGLAIARGIVEEHGGAVAIESELGRGTRASVVLPIARA